MSARVLRAFLAALFAVAGCSAPDSSRKAPSPTIPASFVNRVWVVAESPQVAPGELRVFLSEGTLVMASTHGTPAFGTWRQHDGHLTITEEGLEYEVDILELSGNAFRIRMHGPGEPVDIRFQPAGQPPGTENSPAQPDGR